MSIDKKIAQIIVTTLIIMLITPFITAIVAPTTTKVYAAEIEREKAYTGLALTIVLVYLIDKLRDGAEAKEERKKFVSNDYSKDELYWLAKAIHAEARGEPYRGKVAVAAVILNRVESDEFHNTIYSVIHQEGQFSSVADGQINLNPNATAYKAAREALEGNDPSHGALYFYNPKTSSPVGKAWLDKRPRTVVIGNHAFAK